MLSNARGSHISPGFYSKEIDVKYAVENLGSTTLGLAGETLKGPAFEPKAIKSWSDFVRVFGSTSPAKFKGTGLPKYELPYIAESYLKASRSLLVCRALGLSGYDAGKAWALKVSVDNKYYLVGILRSKGEYKEPSKTGCSTTTETTSFFVDKIQIADYEGSELNYNCTEDGSSKPESKPVTDPSKATIKCYNGEKLVASYSVSLNPADSDYICSVLGTSPSEVSASKIYVENFYDNAYEELNGAVIVKTEGDDEGVGSLNDYFSAYRTPVTPWIVSALTSNNEAPQVKKLFRFVTISDGADANTEVKVSIEKVNPDAGTFDVVVRDYSDIDSNPTILEKFSNCNLTLGDSNFIGMKIGTVDGDYELKSQYICVELSGDVEALENQVPCGFLGYPMFNHVFSGTEVVPVSYNKRYENAIRAKKQYFGFSSRTGFDNDILTYKGNVLESEPRYVEFDNNGVSIEEGYTKKYALPEASDSSVENVKVPYAYYEWEEKFKYVEEIEDAAVGYIEKESVPVEGLTKTSEKHIKVNGKFYSLQAGKNAYVMVGAPKEAEYAQYVEVSDHDLGKRQEGKDKVCLCRYYNKKTEEVSVAFDNVKYLGNGFHLDSRIGELNQKMTVDGERGYAFDCVDADNIVDTKSPMIGSDELMKDTIYEDINLRKFTVLFYGGFDGWNVHESKRTTADRYNAYKMGTPKAENKTIRNFSDASLVGKANTSDYYAYLMAYRQFANPEKYDINLFATPGIDYVNNTLLVEDVLDMLTDQDDGRGGDALYITTTPYMSESGSVYTIDEVADNVEEANIDSSYAATYFPWVKFYDSRAKQYIALPATKDVLRNMAEIDSKSYPWFTPAGIDRGTVDCVRAMTNTVLADEDTLYGANINPVKTFAKDGVKLWGNKTLYTEDTPLNRINVRRLMLRVKKLIGQACRILLFDPNDDTAKKKFLSIVEPILDDVKTNRGIYDYRIVVDDSVEAGDRHELPALISIKPTPTLEYIDVTFKITPEGASFDE